MQAVILAGGKGTRLQERLQGRPKPLVEVGGVPLLKRQIEALKANGVVSVLILVNHAADQIAAFCSENDNFGLDLELRDDGEPLGTAGALLAAFDELDERFVVVYGDTLFDIDLRRMVASHEEAGADVTLFVHPNDHPADSDLVELDENGMVIAFHAYPHPSHRWLSNLVNAAFYIIEKKALSSWRQFPVPSDLAKNLFPKMLAQGARLHAYRSFEYIKDLGTPTRLDKVEGDLAKDRPFRARSDRPQPCVFLDRDGTLNEHIGHLRSCDELRLIPGAREAVRRLNAEDYRTAVITNQPVVARGECSFDELKQIHNKLETELGNAGAYLDGIWWCPHHPDAGYAGERPELKTKCSCRKPEPGLILAAAKALNADLSRSWLIGDSTADILAARRAGVCSILVETGEGGRDGKYSCEPDFLVRDLNAAADLILSKRNAA